MKNLKTWGELNESVKKINRTTELPKQLFFNGKEYKGEAAFINGYNGYTSTPTDGMLCALIKLGEANPSCWNDKSKPNTLLDKNGNSIKSTNLRGLTITI